MRIFHESHRKGRLRISLDALRVALDCTQVLAKMAGELGDRIEVTVAQSADLYELQKVILDALDPFPEAKVVLAEALRKYGRENGGDEAG